MLRTIPHAWLITLLVAAAACGAEPMPQPVPPGPPPPLTLPAEVRQDITDNPVTVTAATSAKQVFWFVRDGLWSFQGPDGMTIQVRGNKVGTYLLTACVLIDGKPVFADCRLVVESKLPGPGPTPPPAPPQPEGTLRADVLKLAAQETGPDRAANVKKLAAVYRQAARLVNERKKDDAGEDTKEFQIDTAGLLADKVREAATSLLGSGKIMLDLRRRVAAEIWAVTKLTADDSGTLLTADMRALMADVYTRAAAALDEVAK